MKLKITAGTTNRMVRIYVQDNSKSSGTGLAGLVYNTSGLTWYYSRVGDNASTQVTLATATLGSYTSGGFVAVDGTNMTGVYEIGIPNACLATGSTAVHMMLQGAANMAPVAIEIELDAVNYQDSVRFGLTALPNAAAPVLLATVNDASPTTSSFKGSAGLSSTDNFYVGSYVAFTSGTLAGIAHHVTSYTGATKLLTLGTAFPVAPTNGDAFMIIGATS